MGEKSIPFRIGDYVAFDRIGKGGMAEIFLARTTGCCGAGKKVVLKIILPYLGKIPSFVAALMNEAKIMERIRSPFVTQVADAQVRGEDAWIAMEYVEGVDLHHLLGLFSKKKLRVPEELLFHVITCLLQGLASVHGLRDEAGRPLDLIHLDLSPGNVLVSFAAEVKLCDFGVAVTGDAARILAQSKEVRGKLSYMSPEQAAGLPLDRRSDLFSAGIIFWELLSGRKLYSSSDKDKVYQMAAEAQVPPLEPGRFARQEALEAILARALAREPAQRYGSALEFLDAVAGYVRARKLVVSQLSLASFLEEAFSEEILRLRYERERVMSMLLPVEV